MTFVGAAHHALLAAACSCCSRFCCCCFCCCSLLAAAARSCSAPLMLVLLLPDAARCRCCSLLLLRCPLPTIRCTLRSRKGSLQISQRALTPPSITSRLVGRQSQAPLAALDVRVTHTDHDVRWLHAAAVAPPHAGGPPPHELLRAAGPPPREPSHAAGPPPREPPGGAGSPPPGGS